MSLLTAKDQKSLQKSTIKALRPLEKRVKLLEVQNIISISLRNPTAGIDFWNISLKQSLRKYRFSAWKFCCLLHKLVRDGHSEMLTESIRREQSLAAIYEYWRNQQQSDYVAIPITYYSYALLLKLQFHRNYTFLEGNLHLKDDRPWDLNICFQLVTDIFDLLQAFAYAIYALFADLQRHKLPSMSKQAQCRLMTLNTMIMECDSLYAHSMTAMYILSSALTIDDMSGLCKRLTDIRDQLKQLSVHCDIQLKLPVIPENFFGPTRTTNLYPTIPIAPTAPPLD